MNKSHRTLAGRFVRLGAFLLLAATLFVGTSLLSSTKVEANHPVLLEGNCDSPVPGTTIVNIGQCGDFDGDGRIGTAEDTDGADRIFGTLRAAIGPGTGAAAGTGANYNGTILIVKSGRFSEPDGTVLIGVLTDALPGQGTANPGNVTIEAAPGVVANIDAVLQGDPAGGNTSRQNGAGILINYLTADNVVTLRNLTFRNWFEGVGIAGRSRVVIDNCTFDNNLREGVLANALTQVVVTRSRFTGNGRRVPGAGPSPGDGLVIAEGAQARVSDSIFSHNAAAGIRNTTGSGSNVVIYKVATYFNGTDIIGPVTITTNPNYSF